LAVLVIVVLVIGIAGPVDAGEWRLAFPVAGVVDKVLVRSGQKVSEGTPMAVLDLQPMSAVKRAADARFVAATLDHKLALAMRQRVQQLYDDLSTSAEELEGAESKLAAAAADLAQASADAVIAGWNLDHGTLRAPRSGVVSGIPGYIGLVVNPKARFTPVVNLN